MILRLLYKINISPFVYIIGLLSILTGLFKSFLIMYLIIIIHELGHVFFAYLFGYEIIKINIYPFGGYTLFDTYINNTFLSELLVFFGGILFQCILYLFFYINISHDSYIYSLFCNYNKIIILFNLFPIIPLDGSKILNIFINKILSFKSSHILTIYISYICIIILFCLFYKDLNIIIMLLILLYFIIIEHKNHLYIFNTFLLERYLYNFKFKSNNIINSIDVNKIKKYKNNVFIYNNKYIDEKEVLKNRYKK